VEKIIKLYGLKLLTTGNHKSKFCFANVRAAAMKLKSHQAFFRKETMHAHREGLSRFGLFAFLNYCSVRR